MMYLGKEKINVINLGILPENVRVATFILNQDTTTDITIQNPFHSLKYKKIICINFSEEEFETGVSIGFTMNLTSTRDGDGNGKLKQSSLGGVAPTSYYPLASYTENTLTLRHSYGGYKKGTYYMFAWCEEQEENNG